MPVLINWFRIALLFCILLLLHTHRFIATDGKFQFLFIVIVLPSSNNMATIVHVCLVSFGFEFLLLWLLLLCVVV